MELESTERRLLLTKDAIRLMQKQVQSKKSMPCEVKAVRVAATVSQAVAVHRSVAYSVKIGFPGEVTRLPWPIGVLRDEVPRMGQESTVT